MRSKKYGFTLIELLITLAVVGVFLAIIVGSILRLLNNPGTNDEAHKWAAGMGIPVQGLQCAEMDTDGDGYISCTLSTKKPNGELEMIPIECAARFSINDGCRMQKPGTVRLR